MINDDLFLAQAESIPQELTAVAASAAQSQDKLLDMDNVVGVGVGLKVKDGHQTTTPSVMVMVSSKMPVELLNKGNTVPKTVSSQPTDVIEVGHLFAGGGSGTRALSDADARAITKRARPVRPGFSVGHVDVTAGTIGAACYDSDPHPGVPRRFYILSNNHVLANNNDANVGDPILQPGRHDGGVEPDDVLGQLTRFVPIDFTGKCNHVDGAIAEVPFDQIDRDIFWVGYPRSAAKAAKVGMTLKKTGRTTDFTTGKVTVLGATVNVNYGGGRVARFCNQIVTTAMSSGGDSGSLVLDWENNPVGLLFAGSDSATILNPIGLVQLELGIRIWP